jgi:hypothetical protein
MRMYRRLIVSIATAAAMLAATPAFGQSFQLTQTPAFGQSFQQTPPPKPPPPPPQTPAPAQPTMQRQPNTGVGFGIHFGGAWTGIDTQTNDFDIDTGQGTGIVAGIFFGGNRDGRAGLQGEVSYLEKKVNNNEEGLETLKNTYLQIPVLLRINTGSRSNNGPSLFFLVGPAFDIKIGDNAGDIFDEDELDLDDVYEGLEIGLMAGVGFEVARFGVQFRYTWGLNNVLGTDAANAVGFGDTKFNTFQITGIFRIN